MKGLVAFTLPLLSVMASSAALAQDVDGRSSGVGAVYDADKAQVLASSFDTLPLLLEVGREVIVREEAGRATRGKLVSVSGDQLVVSRRWLWRREERVFTEDVVRRIEIVDSVKNGRFIGAAVGAPVLAWSIWKMKAEDGDLSHLYVIFFGVPAILLGPAVGGLIDSRINRPVYDRPSQSRRITITIAPWLARNQKGVMAQVRF